MRIAFYSFLLSIVMTWYACTTSTNNQHCTETEYSGSIAYAETGPFGNLYPLSVDNVISQRIVSLIHEGLVLADPQTFSIKPGIADTWRIDTSETEYRFMLNQNVYFHDDECFKGGKGRKVTIDDVIYCFTRLCKPDEKNKAAAIFIEQIVGAEEYANGKATSVSGIIRENDSTLVIRLKKPNPMFLQFLATPAAVIYPKEAVEKYGYSMAVGIGPFCVYQFPENDKPMILCKNGKYFKTDAQGNCIPYIDTVKIYFNKPLREQLDMLLAGKIDLVINIDNETLTGFLEKNVKLFEGKSALLKVIAGYNFTSIQTQHIVRKHFENIIINDANQIDFRELKVLKDTIQ